VLVPYARLLDTEVLSTSTLRLDSSGTAFIRRKRVFPPEPHPTRRRIVPRPRMQTYNDINRTIRPTVSPLKFCKFGITREQKPTDAEGQRRSCNVRVKSASRQVKSCKTVVYRRASVVIMDSRHYRRADDRRLVTDDGFTKFYVTLPSLYSVAGCEVF